MGQLVATMRANRLNTGEASVELDLPVELVKEALSYYAANRALVDRELREEKLQLKAKGYPV